MKDCIFCSIANGDPDKFIWQNDVAVAFNDLYPKSPVHILVVPKEHLRNLDELEDVELAGKLLLAVREVAHVAGVKDGWRLQVNNGSKVGQTVHHLHFHIRGGVEMAD